MPVYEICTPLGHCEKAKLEIECGNIYSSFLVFTNGMRWNYTSDLSDSGESVTVEKLVFDTNSGTNSYMTLCTGSTNECSEWTYKEIESSAVEKSQ
ncbi:hypothetical protein JCM14722_23600 [Pseudodesulfovibrio portus]|uniref:Uncharacterized protein n=1 Tax=Pseudodesulfovibrio portus TaxID=231439 RepID=A0ABM8ATI0_9BACT|nr:hypothetical protein JCM14722_23600 [Pseudodesulfovibrio portus]